MAEYIKREAALQIIDYAKQLTSEQIVRESGAYELLSDTGKACYDGIITALAMCKRLINEAVVVADVQPVNRGRWIETHISLCKWIPGNEKEEGHNFYMAELKCSCCERYNTVTFALSLTKPDFCQLCGARMDGEQND